VAEVQCHALGAGIEPATQGPSRPSALPLMLPEQVPVFPGCPHFVSSDLHATSRFASASLSLSELEGSRIRRLTSERFDQLSYYTNCRDCTGSPSL
jgi:hypothetical protein